MNKVDLIEREVSVYQSISSPRVPSSMDSSFGLFLLCCRVSHRTLKRRHEDSEDCTYIKASKKPVTITEEHVRNAIYFFVMDFLFRNPNPGTSFFLSPLKVMPL